MCRQQSEHQAIPQQMRALHLGRVARLVYKSLFKNSRCYILVRLTRMNKEVIIPATEAIDPLVDPNGLHIFP